MCCRDIVCRITLISSGYLLCKKSNFLQRTYQLRCRIAFLYSPTFWFHFHFDHSGMRQNRVVWNPVVWRFFGILGEHPFRPAKNEVELFSTTPKWEHRRIKNHSHHIKSFWWTLLCFFCETNAELRRHSTRLFFAWNFIFLQSSARISAFQKPSYSVSRVCISCAFQASSLIVKMSFSFPSSRPSTKMCLWTLSKTEG